MQQITIYTDGACSGNPGAGGWGAILIYKDYLKEISGAEKETTNNRMELLAVIKALSLLKKEQNVVLYSDSAYVVNAFNQKWIDSWTSNGWKTSGRKPVQNKDLWMQLLSILKRHKVKFVKVKGHADNQYNNRCDEIARQAIKDLQGADNGTEV